MPVKKTDVSVLTGYDIDVAASRLLRESNTNFYSLIKNLENNSELYSRIEPIITATNRSGSTGLVTYLF
ncbi:MAG: hypothetical protein GY757_24510 [bacterium]|nr:hypothetical protein [bacterium]